MLPLGEELVLSLAAPSAGNTTVVSVSLCAGAGNDGTSIRRPAVTVRFGTGVKRSSP